MSFHIDATSMFATFGTTLTVYPLRDKNAGHRENGRWIPDPEPAPITVTEPFLPMGRVSDYSEMRINRDTGDIERYSAEWLSPGDYAIGTAVVNHGTRYLVRNKDDYTDYSNLTIYYMQADEEDNRDQGGDSNDATL